MSTDQQAEFAKRIARLERKQGGLWRARPKRRTSKGAPLQTLAALVRLTVMLIFVGAGLKALAIYAIGESTYRTQIFATVGEGPASAYLLPDPVTLALSRAIPR